MSKIEWTDQTWNPSTGCSKVSAGCANCYAETMARRLHAMGAPGYDNGFDLTLMPDRLNLPLNRRKPTRFFVNSMSDLFHEGIPDEYLDQVFDVIRRTPRHTYQILTKRSSRLPEYFRERAVPSNVWLGVTVEDRNHGVARIDDLRKVDASIRFLSCEPLLQDLGSIDLTGIHWVIVGGESGPKARPMSEEWVVSIKEQCDASGSAFFFKQWGTWGRDMVKRSKKANGRQLLGRTWDAYPREPAKVRAKPESVCTISRNVSVEDRIDVYQAWVWECPRCDCLHCDDSAKTGGVLTCADCETEYIDEEE